MVKPPPAVRMLGASGLLAVSSSGCTRSRKISEASLILSSLIATESLKLRDNLVEAGMVIDTVCWGKSLVAVRWRDGNFLSDKAKYRTIYTTAVILADSHNSPSALSAPSALLAMVSGIIIPVCVWYSSKV